MRLIFQARQKSRLLSQILLLALIALPLGTNAAKPMFESYSKIMLGLEHAGVVVQRFSFDSEKKVFHAYRFIQMNEKAGGFTETLRARATEALEPLYFKYELTSKDKTQIIEASFKGNNLILNVTQNGKLKQSKREIPTGVFLSVFLNYAIIKGQSGPTPGVRYTYRAMTEEDAQIYDGIALIREEVDYMGVKALRIDNEFKDSTYVFYMTSQGDSLSTKDPIKGIATEIVTEPELATRGFKLNSTKLKLLFGNIPVGKLNPVFTAIQKQPNAPVK